MKVQAIVTITPWIKGPKEYCDSRCKYIEGELSYGCSFPRAYCHLFNKKLQPEIAVSDAGVKVEKMRRCKMCMECKIVQ